MEQIYYFVLGVLFVLACAGVYSVFRLRVQVKNLGAEIQQISNEIDNLYRSMADTEDNINRTIVDDIRDVHGTIREIKDHVNQVDGRIDSRADKLTNAVAEQIAEIHRQLNRLEEAIEKYAETLS